MPKRLADPHLVHIGFHKTGTTWLQTGLFRTEPFFLGWNSMDIASTIILTHSLDWSTDAARAELSRRVASPPQASALAVMSWERLSGSPHAGGYDSALIAERLHDLYPETRVLIGIREQRSMIEALYRQYVRDGGIASLSGYLRPRNAAEIPQFRFDHLAYDRLVSHYIDMFGPERVLVLPYEKLVADQAGYVEEICRFCGLERPIQPADAQTYGGLRPTTTLLKRQANKVIVRNSLSPAARYHVRDHEARFDRINEWLPRRFDNRIRATWSKSIAESVVDLYSGSNARLAEIIRCRLGEYGYANTHRD